MAHPIKRMQLINELSLELVQNYAKKNTLPEEAEFLAMVTGVTIVFNQLCESLMSIPTMEMVKIEGLKNTMPVSPILN